MNLHVVIKKRGNESERQWGEERKGWNEEGEGRDMT